MTPHESDRQRRRYEARRRDRRRIVAQRVAALALLGAVAAATFGAATGDRSRAAPTRSQPARDAQPTVVHRARKLGPLQRARVQAVAWARARNGMHEVGTTNCSPAIARWERNMGLTVPSAPPCAPWCGAFVHEAFFQAGVDLSARIMDPNQSYWDSVGHDNGLRKIPKASVRPGDIVFFALHGVDNQATHEEIVLAMPRNGRVLTAGGNVGHHAVTTRRGLRYIMAAARVTRKPTRA